MAAFTKAEVSKHCTEDDAWIIIDDKVYDITKFIKFHPGGKAVLVSAAGKDATEDFWALHRASDLEKYAKRFYKGYIAGTTPGLPTIGREDGAISKVPYAENSFLQGFRSTYLTEKHNKFRQEIRKVYDKHVKPVAEMHERTGKHPSIELYQALGAGSILAGRIGPGHHLKGINLPLGMKPEEFTYFHEMIVHEENALCGCPAFADGIGAGLTIGLPPIINFGSPELQQRIVPDCLAGRKRICLAITEPFAGSDVANIRCTAKLTPDGKHYIVNGVKKWITCGDFSDYFTTAVRTGGKGIGGISLLLIERGPGVTTKAIKTSYSSSAGTAYVFFDNAKVPATNIVGKLNMGFKHIMYNFNHERWLIVVGVVRYARLVVEECLKWAHQRKVFGKPLINQPVIRLKLANMIAEVESVYNWLENITYQMTQMPYSEQSVKLAGPIALLKLRSTRMSLFVSDNACQIFGGRAITRTGMGRIIEGFQRTVKYGAILGGSEEIMGDLGARQALKKFPLHSKL